MGYNAVQKQVLEALLDQYERSKTYQGENKVIQSLQIPPEKVSRTMRPITPTWIRSVILKPGCGSWSRMA